MNEVWGALDKVVRGCVLEGSPGVGKSTALWGYACDQSQNHAKEVLWIHLEADQNEKEIGLGVQLSRGSCKHAVLSMDDIVHLLESSSVSMVMIDGFRHGKGFDKIKTLLAPMRIPSRKTFISSSLGGGFNREDLLRKGIGLSFVPSWDLETFEKAVLNDDFFEDVKIALGFAEGEGIIEYNKRCEKVATKFTKVGVSARYMFQYTEEDVIRLIDGYLAKVSSYKGLLDMDSGEKEAQAVNHLTALSLINGKRRRFFSSPYVLEQIVLRCGAEAIRKTYSVARMLGSNPAFLGWIAEYDFCDQLNKSVGLENPIPNIVDGDGVQIRIEVPGKSLFDPEEILPSQLFQRGHWMVPTRWNQGGYDLARLIQVSGKRIMQFFQITRAHKHKIKTRFLRTLVVKLQDALTTEEGTNSIAISGIDIVIVIPLLPQQCTKDTFPKPPTLEFEGNLADWYIGETNERWSNSNTSECKVWGFKTQEFANQ